MILCIETSGEICSIALAASHDQVFYLENRELNAHSKFLLPMIDSIFAENQLPKHSLNAIALSAGPGSYTGLRIGSAAAKSICMAYDIPLISISTLEILATAMHNTEHKSEYLVPLLDARRMEVYTAVFDSNAKHISMDMPHILSENTALLWNNMTAALAGSGADKTHQYLNKLGIETELLVGLYPNANNMVTLALEKFDQQDFTNLLNFQPYYLKPFYTTATPIQYNTK